MTTLVTPQDIFQKDDLHAAIDQMKVLFPDQAERFEQEREKLIQEILKKKSIENIAPIQINEENEQTYLSKSLINSNFVCTTSAPLIGSPVKDLIGGCQFALIQVSFNIVAFVCSLLGCKVSFNAKIAQKIWDCLEKSGDVDELLDALIEFKDAEGAFDKASALFKAFTILMEVGVFGAVLDAIKESATWWEWSLMVVSITAMITAWVASGGAAFVALAAVRVMAACDLISSTIEAVKECCLD